MRSWRMARRARLASSLGCRSGRASSGLVLTTLLVLGVVVEVDRLVGRVPSTRVDYSEDGLYGLSPVTARVLGQLEDTLSVHAFFTAEIESGRAAIEKARVEAQLEELRALAGGRMLVDVRDPSVDSQAELDARTHGLQARPVQAAQGTGLSRQLVHRSLLLRYRGRQDYSREGYHTPVPTPPQVPGPANGRETRTGHQEPGTAQTGSATNSQD